MKQKITVFVNIPVTLEIEPQFVNDNPLADIVNESEILNDIKNTFNNLPANYVADLAAQGKLSIGGNTVFNSDNIPYTSLMQLQAKLLPASAQL